MRATFRADASSGMGSGHVMRCLALADDLRATGWDCAFAVRPGSLEAAPALALSGHEVLTLDGTAGQDAGAIERRWPEGSDWLIVDHYGLDDIFERACRPWAKRIMVIDDLANRRHDCDVLLDQTLNRAATDYDGLVPPACSQALGTRYAVLRPEFAALRPTALASRRYEAAALRLLVSLGGTDPDNATSLVLDAVAASGLESAVDVVVGGGSPWLAHVAGRVAEIPGARLHVGPRNMGALMAAADLAIGAAGTSSWERCCLGLPTIMLVLADNQRENAKQLAAAGAVRCVAQSGEALVADVAALIRELAGDRAALRQMSAQAAALCDGQGALRTRLFLLPARPTKDGRGVALRHAEAGDEAILLHWQQQPAIRGLARNPRIPTPEEHGAWFAAKMRSDSSFITIIEHGGETAGMLRLDRQSAHPEHLTYEVSIVVDERHRSVGVGLGALQLIRQWMPEANFVAETVPGNTASLVLFGAAGYTQTARNLLRCPAIR
jgi:UDP-2,4-diacetamido-2,4,6-trideoxy-beta-L-altropyranose hydrolase